MKTHMPIFLAALLWFSGSPALGEDDYCDNSELVEGSCVTEVVPVADFADASCVIPEQGESACPEEGEAYYGQDANYLIDPDDAVMEDGAWKESVTGLWWNPEVDAVDSLAEAEAACAAHGEENLAGRNDWRVPELREYGRILSPRYDPEGVSTSLPEGFDSFPSNKYYYTSTVTNTNSGISDQVTVHTIWVGYSVSNPEPSGGIGGDAGNGNYLVHCVSGPVMSGTWQLEEDDSVVLHTTTGLFWEQSPNLVDSWGEGLATCENSTTGNFDDWRTPNLREGLSMLDTSAENDSLLAPVFDAAEGEFSPAFVTSNAYDTSFENFSIYDEFWRTWPFFYKLFSDTELAVRCVRGPIAVPEPSTALLAATAMGLLAALRRKRARA